MIFTVTLSQRYPRLFLSFSSELNSNHPSTCCSELCDLCGKQYLKQILQNTKVLTRKLVAFCRRAKMINVLWENDVVA